MARQSTHPQSVVSLDPVWDRIRDEAQEAARKDPSLGGFIFGALTNTDWTTGINIGTLVAAIVGAIIVVFVWNTVTKRGGTRAV